MSKAMLIMDKPESCKKCKLSRCLPTKGVGICCVNRERFDDITKMQDWCPLREVPEKYEDVSMDFERGYNACIDEILGGDK